MAASQYSILLSELRKLSSSPPQNEETRQELSSALYQASLRLETALGSVRRISNSSLEIVVAKIGIDLGIFDALSLEEELSIDELAERTGAEPGFLIRILRYLASSGMVSQCSNTTYSPTKITHALSNKGFRAGILHHFEVEAPVWFALPSFLASSSYRSSLSPTQTAFQQAHVTNLPAFQWGSMNPRIMHDFALWMTAQRQGEETWLKVFTPKEISGSLEGEGDAINAENQERVLFVDVGGGVGHQCRALRSWLPPYDGRIIFQDLPDVVSLAELGTERIEAMAHDMFSPQPIKNAKFYYLRNILHDHPDTSCMIILENLKAAMGPESILLIDELVLPEMVEQASRDAQTTAALDIVVMAALAGKERTRLEWEHLLGNSGMCIAEIRRYDGLGHSVLVVKKSEASA